MMAVRLVALLLAIADAAVVVAFALGGDFISALGMAVLGTVCIGGGLLAQTASGRTMSTSA